MTGSIPFSRVPNDTLGAPPFDARQAIMHAMLIAGDQAVQQRFCDATLNVFPAARYVFKVASANVLVTSIYVARMGSLDPLAAAKGTVFEADIGFWTLVRCIPASAGANERLAWLPSLMFVDSGSAASAGREIYGYPKCASLIRRSESADRADPTVAIETLSFATSGQDSQAGIWPVVEIAAPPAVLDSAGALSEAATLSALFNEALGIGSALMPSSLAPLPGAGVPQVSLRQFRDATRAGSASLKEVLLTTPSPGAVRAGGTLDAGTIVTVHPSASHDLAALTGIGQRNPILAGGWLDFDFSVGWAERLVP